MTDQIKDLFKFFLFLVLQINANWEESMEGHLKNMCI